MHKFGGEKDFKKRGDIVVSKNQDTHKILDVKVNEIKAAEGTNHSSLFSPNTHYQLSVPELNLLTSMSSEAYLNKIGMNDTITFNVAGDGSSLMSMQVEYIDKEQMATRLGIVNKKKRRDFITP